MKDSGIVTTLSEGEYVFHLMSSTNTDTGDIFHEVVDLGIPPGGGKLCSPWIESIEWTGSGGKSTSWYCGWTIYRIRPGWFPLQYLMIREEEWTPWMVESRMTELEALSNDLTKSPEDLENYSMEMAELEIKLARLESQDLFNLDSSGILQNRGSFDFENNASNYQVWVKVVDDQGASQEMSFSILLIDQNESVEPEDPTDPTDPGIDEIVIHSPDLIGVDENQEFITEINASGVAGVVLSYSILYGDDNGLFKLNQATGDLSFIAPRDFEMPEDANMDNLYEVTIEVSDGTKNALLNLRG